MMTQQEARQRLNLNGMTLHKRDGEYRVNFIENAREATAYYTDDLEDAVLTGAVMRRRLTIKTAA